MTEPKVEPGQLWQDRGSGLIAAVERLEKSGAWVGVVYPLGTKLEQKPGPSRGYWRSDLVRYFEQIERLP